MRNSRRATSGGNIVMCCKYPVVFCLRQYQGSLGARFAYWFAKAILGISHLNLSMLFYKQKNKKTGVLALQVEMVSSTC